MTTYTRFFDMCSGGRQKTPHDVVYIKGSESVAAAKFEEVFGRDPYNTTCDCCGPDFSIEEYDSLHEAQEYDTRWNHNTQTIE
jgi:cytochrome c5